jgi:hypothetical protein
MSQLTDNLVLLALKPKSSGLVKSYLTYSIPGALLIELTAAGRVTIDEKSKTVLLDKTPIVDELADEALQLVVNSRKPRKASAWVMRFTSKIPKLIDRAVQPFIDRGTIQVERRKFLGLIPYRKYHLPDPTPRDQLIQRILNVLRGEENTDAVILSTIQVAHAVSMLNRLLPKDERKQMRKKIKEIGRDEAVGGAVDAAAAAAAAAVTAASVAATTSSSS